MITLGEGLAIAGFSLNAGAIIWGAAKLSSSVERLEKDFKEINLLVRTLIEKMHTANGKIAILEYVSKIRSFDGSLANGDLPRDS